jgi:hypothetical protein
VFVFLLAAGCSSDDGRPSPPRRVTSTTHSAPTTTLPANRDEIAAWFQRARPTLDALEGGVEKVGGTLASRDDAARHNACTELDATRATAATSLLPVPAPDLDHSLRTALDRTADFVRGCLADDMRVMAPLLEPLHDRYEDLIKKATVYAAAPPDA